MFDLGGAWYTLTECLHGTNKQTVAVVFVGVVLMCQYYSTLSALTQKKANDWNANARYITSTNAQLLKMKHQNHAIVK